MKQAQWKMSSKIGRVYLVASEKGLQGVFWEKQSVPMAARLNGSEPEIRILSRAVDELEEYFDGKRRDFGLPLDVNGTFFQKCVWEELGKIPYGKTCSYKDIARRIKNEGAVRAVGSANGSNPLSIIVPCHRVIASNGSLGGYGGGLHIKTKLLELERNGSAA